MISALSSACGSTLFEDESGEVRACDDGWGVAKALADWRRACRANWGDASARRDRRTVDVALDHVIVIVVVVENSLFGYDSLLFFPADAT